MSSGDEYTGGIIDTAVRETSLVSGDLYHVNRHKKQQFCTKNSIKIILFAIAAALSCFYLFKSSSSYNFRNFISSSSYKYQSHGEYDGPSSPPPPADSGMRNSSSINSTTSYSNSSPLDHTNSSRLPIVNKNGEEELEKVLKRAATENKTVIITTLNSAWIAPNSIFDLFLESFKIGNETNGLLNHMVVVALDQKAYNFCRKLHPHCYALTTHGVDFSGEAYFMTADYLKMMWRRIDFLRTVLDLGYSFVFTDADVMWFRNPFLHFHSDTDFQIACDHYWYASTDLDNSPNGGFNYVQSNNRTVKFYKFWYNSKDKYPGRHDQDVLNMIKYDPFIKEIGMSIRFLDTTYFGGFCEPSEDLNQVCTMHANCCIGLENKIHDLKMLIEDWRNYIAMPNEQRVLDPSPTWTVPRICG